MKNDAKNNIEALKISFKSSGMVYINGLQISAISHLILSTTTLKMEGELNLINTVEFVLPSLSSKAAEEVTIESMKAF